MSRFKSREMGSEIPLSICYERGLILLPVKPNNNGEVAVLVTCEASEANSSRTFCHASAAAQHMVQRDGAGAKENQSKGERGERKRQFIAHAIG